MAQRDTRAGAEARPPRLSLRVTQVLGFCFYWA